MRLKIILPTTIFMDKAVNKIIAYAPNGSFCLLPRHVDFVTPLIPGLLYFEPQEEKEEFLAIDEGTLVKCGDEVRISTRHAIGGVPIGKLKEKIEEQFQNLDEKEKKARTALAKLEKDFIRQMLDFGK